MGKVIRLSDVTSDIEYICVNLSSPTVYRCMGVDTAVFLS